MCASDDIVLQCCRSRFQVFLHLFGHTSTRIQCTDSRMHKALQQCFIHPIVSTLYPALRDSLLHLDAPWQVMPCIPEALWYASSTYQRAGLGMVFANVKE
jgi:hypothetical protein